LLASNNDEETTSVDQQHQLIGHKRIRDKSIDHESKKLTPSPSQSQISAVQRINLEKKRK
jgi:hypothetical protein